MKKISTNYRDARPVVKKKARPTDSPRPLGPSAQSAHRGESVQPIKGNEEVQRSNDEHIGSAGAFDVTERVSEEEDSDEDNDDLAMGH